MGWITGKQLRDYLEQELELVFAKNPWKLSGGWGPRASGMSVVFAARNAFGKRVQSLKVDGREIKDGDRITVAGWNAMGSRSIWSAGFAASRTSKLSRRAFTKRCWLISRNIPLSRRNATRARSRLICRERCSARSRGMRDGIPCSGTAIINYEKRQHHTRDC